MVDEVTVGFSDEPLGFPGVGDGRTLDLGLHKILRQNIGLDPPRLEPSGPMPIRTWAGSRWTSIHRPGDAL